MSDHSSSDPVTVISNPKLEINYTTPANDPKNIQEMTLYVQSVLQIMQDKFESMTDQIISRIDDMTTRVDEMEKTIAEIMIQVGVEPDK